LLHCFCLIKVEYSCDDWNWPPISFQFLKAARCCSLCGDEETSEEPSLSVLIDIFWETFVCQFPSNFFFSFQTIYACEVWFILKQCTNRSEALLPVCTVGISQETTIAFWFSCGCCWNFAFRIWIILVVLGHQ